MKHKPPCVMPTSDSSQRWVPRVGASQTRAATPPHHTIHEAPRLVAPPIFQNPPTRIIHHKDADKQGHTIRCVRKYNRMIKTACNLAGGMEGRHHSINYYKIRYC